MASFVELFSGREQWCVSLKSLQLLISMDLAITLTMKNHVADLLKNEFTERKRKNKKYSLRAFSRDLKISPGFLSDILGGRKKVSLDKALSITQSLGWSWRDTQIFFQTAQLGNVKSLRVKKFLKSELRKTEIFYGQFQKLKPAQFFPISDWYYVALMELVEVPGFSDDPTWVAKKLGIKVKQAEVALSQLQEAKFIHKNDQGLWMKSKNNTVQDTPSAEIRKFHRQHLENAAEAIEKQEFSRRHFSGVTMAIDTDKLPEAVQLIREFRSRMNALLESGTKKSVYHLAIQLFQLDHSLKKNSEDSKNV